MNRRSIDPAFTFAVSLAVSLVLWFPTMTGTMHGTIEITDAGIRYFLALAIAWAGVYGVSALVAMYASKPREAQGPLAPPPTDPASKPSERAHRDSDTAVATSHADRVDEYSDSNAA